MHFLTAGNEYFFIKELLSEVPVIVQVGAYHLRLLRDLVWKMAEAHVIVYEPALKTFTQLVKVCGGLPNIVLHNKAVVGNHDGITGFQFFPDKPQASSVYSNRGVWKPWKELGEWHTVTCVSLQSVFKENKLKSIDVLLLDCEGSEMSILQELADKPQLYVRQVHVEVDLETGLEEAEWRSVRRRLEHHYELIQELNFVEVDTSPVFLFRRKTP